jgi:phosphoribosyl-ATP pyrophosphohydrolase/phosphoribosyl-AMP cyclohydrolase
MLEVDALDFAKGGGLVTVVAQDARSGVVLMVAHSDRVAIERTIATGEMHYHSRSRGAWHKGAASGNTQRVVSLSADCDGDAVLARVVPAGPACHTGAPTCFGAPAPVTDALWRLDAAIAERAAAAGDAAAAAAPSHTQRLLRDRNLRLKKLGEEAAELAIACADGDAERAAEEGADLVYHALVALRAVGVTLEHLERVLARRAAGGGDRGRPA